MVHKIINQIIACAVAISSLAQPIYKLKEGKVSFFAGTPMEDIDAVTNKFQALMNTETGEVFVSIKNTDFKFKRSLMQEHFNENYMESDKYPKSEFKGLLSDVSVFNNATDKPVNTIVKGVLSMHGVSKEKEIPLQIKKSDKAFFVHSEFEVFLEEFKIDRPKILWEKLAEKVKITLHATLAPYEK